jgi:hypothetical protein
VGAGRARTDILAPGGGAALRGPFAPPDPALYVGKVKDQSRGDNMADFSIDPEFQEQLDWIRAFSSTRGESH